MSKGFTIGPDVSGERVGVGCARFQLADMERVGYESPGVYRLKRVKQPKWREPVMIIACSGSYCTIQVGTLTRSYGKWTLRGRLGIRMKPGDVRFYRLEPAR